MKALIAFRGGGDGREALALGSTLRRSTDAALVVAAVLPPVSERPGPGRVDLEYREWLDDVAANAKAEATAILAPQDPGAVEFRRLAATSVAAGLTAAASDSETDVLILGSARAATEGSFLTGSVADRLLHSSPVPLLLAPQGYSDDGATFSSLTCAYAGTERSREALRAAADLALRYGIGLRITTFVPTAEAMYPPEVGLDAEDLVAAQWAEQAVALHAEAVDQCREWGVDPVDTVVGRGRGWAGALAAVPWQPHDILVLGSSRLGPLARVFLGSIAGKILRHTPVPTLVVPAGTVTWTS